MSENPLISGSPLAAHYHAVHPRVGESSTTDLGVLDRVQIQRYALTVGLGNPIHRDVDAARAAGYDDIVAPPNFLSAMFEWGPGTPEHDLQPDGTPPGDMETSSLRGMGAGEELEILNPVIAGQHLQLEESLEAVVAKATRGGPCVFVTTALTFSTTDGTVLNRNKRTVVLRDLPEEN